MVVVEEAVLVKEEVGERRRTAGTRGPGKCGVWESSELEGVVLDFLLTGGLSGFAGLDWPLLPPCMSRERERGLVVDADA